MEIGSIRKEKSLLIDLFKAFDKIERSYKSIFFLTKRRIFFCLAVATCSVLPWFSEVLARLFKLSISPNVLTRHSELLSAESVIRKCLFS